MKPIPNSKNPQQWSLNHRRILIKNNYTLNITTTQQKILELELQIQVNQVNSLIYTNNIRSMSQLGKIQQYCDNLEEFAEYMTNQDTLMVDIVAGSDQIEKNNQVILVIYGQHLLKKDQKIQLCSIMMYKGQQKITQNYPALRRKVIQLEQAIIEIKQQLLHGQIFASPNMDKKLIEQTYVTRQHLKQQTNKLKQELLHQYHNCINSYLHQSYQPPSLMNSTIEYSIFRGKEQSEIEAARERQISMAKELYDHIITKLTIPSLILDVKEDNFQSNSHIINVDKKQNEKNEEVNMSNNITTILLQRLEQFIAQTQINLSRINQRITSISSAGLEEKSQHNSSKSDMKQKKKSHLDKYKQPEPVSKPIVAVQKWLDPKCLEQHKFSIIEGALVAKESSLMFGAQVIDKQYSYTVIIQRMSKFIELGIIDRKYNYNSSNLVYYQNDGNCKYGVEKKKHGAGFKVGDSIRVEIHRGLGTVQWKVSGQARIKIKYDKIKNNEVQWVPYLYLGCPQDCVVLSQ